MSCHGCGCVSLPLFTVNFVCVLCSFLFPQTVSRAPADRSVAVFELLLGAAGHSDYRVRQASLDLLSRIRANLRHAQYFLHAFSPHSSLCFSLFSSVFFLLSCSFLSSIFVSPPRALTRTTVRRCQLTLLPPKQQSPQAGGVLTSPLLYTVKARCPPHGTCLHMYELIEVLSSRLKS